MGLISAGELGLIVGRTSGEFAAWFVEESLIYFGDDPKKKIMAFEPLEHLIVASRDRTEAECLADIFRALGTNSESRTQSNWRIGLAKGFERLVREWGTTGWLQASVVNSARLLLNTAKLVRCSEIVASIEAVFSDIPDLFGDTETYWDDLFETLARVMSENDADRVSRMIASHGFRSYMAPMAFLALCRADKSRFPTWLQNLRPSLTQLHQEPNERRYAFLTAQRFAKYVDVETVARLLCLTQIGPDARDGEKDNWLLEALVGEQQSPWILTEDHKLGWRNDNPRTPIEILISADWKAREESDFVAALDWIWRKSIQSKPLRQGSLLGQYRDAHQGREAENIQRACRIATEARP